MNPKNSSLPQTDAESGETAKEEASMETPTMKVRGRSVTPEEALQSAYRLINSHFRNKDGARCSIPTRWQDDDVTLIDFILQQPSPSPVEEVGDEEAVKAVYPSAYINDDYSGAHVPDVGVFRKATKEDWPKNREIPISGFFATAAEAWKSARSKLPQPVTGPAAPVVQPDDPCKMTDEQYEDYIYGPNRAKWPTNEMSQPTPVVASPAVVSEVTLPPLSESARKGRGEDDYYQAYLERRDQLKASLRKIQELERTLQCR